MNMEQLTKSQIVLLTLLVSFVTSIATGIVTVSLMDQAPPAIAQTVNRIVERTVERIVSSGPSAASVVTQEKTIIVKEYDLISKAITRIEPSVVRLYSTAEKDPAFLGLGVVADDIGTIVSDSTILNGAESAVVERADKTRVLAQVSLSNATSGLVYFTTATSTADGKPATWKPFSIGGRPVLGESVVAVSGKTIARIAAGLVTTLTAKPDEASVQIIETDIDPDSILSGSPLIDTDGGLLGISTGVSRSVSPSGFISSSVLVKSVEKLSE